jgi:methyltransferase family protein
VITHRVPPRPETYRPKYDNVEDLVRIMAAATFPQEVDGVVPTRLTKTVIDIPGFIPLETQYFLNEVCSHGDCQYLEFGTWAGRSVCAAAVGNTGTFTGVDLFEGWTGWVNKEDGQEVWPFQRNQIREMPNVNYVTSDFRNYKPSGPINVFLYDADHSAEATRDGIVQVAPYLNPGLLLVDDAYWPSVQKGINDGLEASRLVVHLAQVLERGEGFFAAVVSQPATA